ncbi:hypothetical protein F5Y18DRAFT_321603 [Xylariaceae sp. FL1019]|nr:hypothetical protein F5Y18DRAFT_321603 [Xylariaceae sp. FL1019]
MANRGRFLRLDWEEWEHHACRLRYWDRREGSSVKGIPQNLGATCAGDSTTRRADWGRSPYIFLYLGVIAQHDTSVRVKIHSLKASSFFVTAYCRVATAIGDDQSVWNVFRGIGGRTTLSLAGICSLLASNLIRRQSCKHSRLGHITWVFAA